MLLLINQAVGSISADICIYICCVSRINRLYLYLYLYFPLGSQLDSCSQRYNN